jgi:DNA-binding transcriptional regulator/RsmH inhibitor MraZ
VAVIGNGRRVEIWSEARWDTYSDDVTDRFTELADKVVQGP